MCLTKDKQTVWGLGNNMSGIFGVGLAKNFGGPKEISFFKENSIELEDVKCSKFGECFFLTNNGKVYQTGGSSDFYMPKQILIEHQIVSMDEDTIFKNCM